MKIMCVLTALLFYAFCYAQPDTALTRRVGLLETAVTTIQTTVKEINAKLPATQSSTASVSNATSVPKEPKDLTTFQQLYVGMPIIAFLIVFITFIVWLKKDGFKLGDALKGDLPIQVEQANTAIPDAVAAAAAAPAVAVPAAGAVVGGVAPVTQVVLPSNIPSTVTVSQTDAQNNPVLPKSSSRFIALFTGMVAIIMSLCLLSYYVYFAIRGTNAPSFDKIFDAVLALGIGVIPYAVNKFTQSK